MTEILITSAAVSNYEGMDALVGQDRRVYLGRHENYHPGVEDDTPAVYDNSDGCVHQRCCHGFAEGHKCFMMNI